MIIQTRAYQVSVWRGMRLYAKQYCHAAPTEAV